MYIWIGLGVIATFLWASVNHIDKYLVSKLFKGSGVGTLMIFSPVVMGIIMTPVFYCLAGGQISMDYKSIALIYVGSTFGIIALFTYFKALEKDDASTVIAVYQTIPVFSYFLGLIFLNEILTLRQILACLVIIVAAVVVTIDFSEKDKHKQSDRIKALVLMLISAVVFALNFFMFKFVAVKTNFYVTGFWEQVFFMFNGIFMFVIIRNFRQGFIKDVRANGVKILSLNLLNESLNLGAKTLYNLASLSLPLAILHKLIRVRLDNWTFKKYTKEWMGALLR